MPIAIDWGNSNTVVAYRANGKEHLFTQKASALLPSFAQYDDEGQLLSVGLEARNALVTGQGHVVAGIKRLIGVGYSPRVARWARRVYGLSLLEENGRIAIEVGNVTKTPEQIATEFFEMLREMLVPEVARSAGLLDHILGKHKVKDCVVTCPAHYNEAQIASLRRCVGDAGLVLLNDRLVPEPQAAGQLLSDGVKAKSHDTSLVVDWGGGTLDFAVIRPDGQCDYLSAAQEECGGIDMDRAILEALEREKRLPAGLPEHDRMVARLLVELRKEELLSGNGDATPHQLQTDGRTVNLSFSRDELVKWIEPILDQAINGVEGVLADTRSSQVKRCVLIGGPVRSPIVAERIRKSVGSIPLTLFPDPMTAVARGALRGVADDVVRGIIPHDYGVTVDLVGHYMGPVLLRAQTTCPAQSEVREMELRGLPGKPVQLAIWARKTDLAGGTIEYESSTAFTFLPRFDQDARAKIRVSLMADASGVITARVMDVTTNQQITLNRVGSAISSWLPGPPCRSQAEVNGLRMLRCWQAYLSQNFFGELDFLVAPEGESKQTEMPEDQEAFERFIQEFLNIKKITLEQLWDDACNMVKRSLRLATAQDSETALDRAVTETQKRLDALPQTVTETSLVDLLKGAERLHTALVRSIGLHEVIPVLTVCEDYNSDKDLQQKVDSLASLFRSFNSNQYERLTACWAEIRADLAVHQAGEDVLQAFDPVMEVVEVLRRQALAIKFHLDHLGKDA